MLYEMRLMGLAMEPFHNSPIVILKDLNAPDDSDQSIIDVELESSDTTFETTLHLEGDTDSEAEERMLPIWIGENEARAIASALLGIKVPRPMTHDLLQSIITNMGGTVTRVIVTDFKDNTFYAVIDIALENGETLSLDSRPSDALALAIRCEASIFVDSSVIDAAYKEEPAPQVSQEDLHVEFNHDKWEEMVEKITGSSVKKYRQ